MLRCAFSSFCCFSLVGFVAVVVYLCAQFIVVVAATQLYAVRHSTFDRNNTVFVTCIRSTVHSSRCAAAAAVVVVTVYRENIQCQWALRRSVMFRLSLRTHFCVHVRWPNINSFLLCFTHSVAFTVASYWGTDGQRNTAAVFNTIYLIAFFVSVRMRWCSDSRFSILDF